MKKVIFEKLPNEVVHISEVIREKHYAFKVDNRVYKAVRCEGSEKFCFCCISHPQMYIGNLTLNPDLKMSTKEVNSWMAGVSSDIFITPIYEFDTFVEFLKWASE